MRVYAQKRRDHLKHDSRYKEQRRRVQANFRQRKSAKELAKNEHGFIDLNQKTDYVDLTGKQSSERESSKSSIGAIDTIKGKTSSETSQGRNRDEASSKSTLNVNGRQGGSKSSQRAYIEARGGQSMLQTGNPGDRTDSLRTVALGTEGMNDEKNNRLRQDGHSASQGRKAETNSESSNGVERSESTDSNVREWRSLLQMGI